MRYIHSYNIVNTQASMKGFTEQHSYSSELPLVSFEMDNYTVVEDEGLAEVCILLLSRDFTGRLDVVISPVVKVVDNSATGKCYLSFM